MRTKLCVLASLVTASLFAATLPQYLDQALERGSKPHFEEVGPDNPWTCLEYREGKEGFGTRLLVKRFSMEEKELSLAILPGGSLVAKTKGSRAISRYLCEPGNAFSVADPPPVQAGPDWKSLKARFLSGKKAKLVELKPLKIWGCYALAEAGSQDSVGTNQPSNPSASQVTFQIIPIEKLFVVATGRMMTEPIIDMFWWRNNRTSGEMYDCAASAIGVRTSQANELEATYFSRQVQVFQKDSSVTLTLRRDSQTGGVIFKYGGLGTDSGGHSTWFHGYALCPGDGK